jgi:carbon storage regulator CsrA
MLVLSRRNGESVEILDGLITIRVLSAKDGRARLAIEAEKQIPVHRGEIGDSRRSEGKAKRYQIIDISDGDSMPVGVRA